MRMRCGHVGCLDHARWPPGAALYAERYSADYVDIAALADELLVLPVVPRRPAGGSQHYWSRIDVSAGGKCRGTSSSLDQLLIHPPLDIDAVWKPFTTFSGIIPARGRRHLSVDILEFGKYCPAL